MGKRVDLHAILISLLGLPNVYFQPPPTIQLKYPCIIYQRQAKKEVFADDKLYLSKKRYSITVVDKDPDSEIPDKIASLNQTTFDRHFVADGLHHDVYSCYY